MEDLDECEGYPTSKEIQVYQQGGSSSRVRWLLDKGLAIGKKLVITGIAISSAPLVLPQLLVFSAMGVAFSVPFGLVFVSYACTNQIMSKLLPTPPPSPFLLEYNVEEEEQRVELGEGEDDCKQVSLTSSDMNVLGSDHYSNEYQDDEMKLGMLMQEEDIKHGEYSQMKEASVDEKGYYTDEEEGKDEVTIVQEEEPEDINQGVEMSCVGGDAYIMQNEQESTTNFDEEPLVDVQQVVELMGDIGNKEGEEEEIVRGSTGFLEKMRDGGEIDEIDMEGAAVNLEEPLVEMHQVATLVDGLGAAGREIKEEKAAECKEVEMVNESAAAEDDGLKTAERIVVEELNSHRLVKDESEKQVGEMCPIVISAGGNERQNVISGPGIHPLNPSNADDESGMDLFDDINAAGCDSLEGNKKVKEDDDVDVLALPGFRRLPLDSDNADKMHPREEACLDEEKIWEEIGAMRAIVGYKAASGATCMEELKALYLFTGVEPPASFKGDEVKEKLKFLMSIVGVK